MPLYHFTLPEGAWFGNHTSTLNPKNRYFSILAEDPSAATDFFRKLIAPTISINEFSSKSVLARLVDVVITEEEDIPPQLTQMFTESKNYLGSISLGRWMLETTDRLYRTAPAAMMIWLEAAEGDKRRLVVIEGDAEPLLADDVIFAVGSKF